MEEWQAKERYHCCFSLDDESGIQSMSPAQIFDTYADGVGWEKQNTVANIRRLKKQYTDKEGPFSKKKTNKGAAPEPFKTKAYTLLLKLYMQSDLSINIYRRESANSSLLKYLI